MDGSPGLITGLAATVGTIASAWINRGAAAGVKELKELVEKTISGPEGRLTKLEAQVTAALGVSGALPWRQAIDEMRTHLNGELAAAKALVEALRREVSGLRRQRSPDPRASTPSLDDDLGRLLGLDEIRRRVEDLERGREDDRKESVGLQTKIAGLVAQIELLIGGKIAFPRKG